MADETRNIELHFDSNASQVNQDISQLNNSIDNVTDSTARSTTATHSNTTAFKSNSNAVLENGGAMGLLNDLTGGYAMMIKDAVEASALFTNAKKADTVATEIQTVATTKVSIATTIWNAILALNPIVAITAGVVALTAGLYYLTKSFLDNKAAVAEVNSSLDLSKVKQEALTKSIQEGSATMTYSNSIEVARAKALGKSSEEIDRLILKQKELVEATAFTNAKNARQAQIQAENQLRNARITGDEDTIKKAQEFLKSQTELYTQYNKDFDAAIVDTSIFRLEIQQKAREKNDAAIIKSNEFAKKAEEDKNKGILEARKKYLQETAIGDELNPVGIDNIIAKIKSDGELENQAKKEVMQADLENKVAYGENLVAEARTRQEAINAVEAELEAKRVEAKKQVFDNIASIVGAETAVGKAALIAKQILLAKELVMEISKTITFSAQAAARSTVALAEGTAQTAKVGFPQNIPLLIGYAAQAAGIFAAIRSAVKASKANISLPTTSSSVGATTAPSVSFVSSSENQLATSISNQNSQQAPIKAYVVSKDMSTAQELDRNLITTTTID